MTLVLIGLVYGLLGAAFAVVVWACARARGGLASAILLVATVGAVLFFSLPIRWLPTPSRVAGGLIANEQDGLLLAAVIAVVSVIAYAVAWRLGAVRCLRRRLDRRPIEGSA